MIFSSDIAELPSGATPKKMMYYGMGITFFFYNKKHLILHFYILLYNSLISLPPPHPPPTSGLDEKYSPVTAIYDDDDD